MAKLILIDGNAILHRAYHALPPLTTRRGEPIGAVYGLISMLLRVIQDLKPTEIAVCFDEKEPTFRHKEFAPYQAQRPVMDEELSGQFEKARRVIEAFGIPIYSKSGFEADDVIGTLAEKAKEDVVIVTGDRDILQLVGGGVKVYLPIAGLSSAKLMGKEEVKE
ncbi:MAG: PIN domain-containing protein, partial [Patescibacteria group bacterium]